MATFIRGMSRLYNLNLRLAPTLNKFPYSSLQKRDFRASCHRYLPEHTSSLTAQDTEVTVWDCVGYEQSVVRLADLPCRATSEDVVKFLGDRVSVVGGKSGVYRPMMRNNLPSGYAFVKLADEKSVKQAMARSKKTLGDSNNAKVEVLKCSNKELNLATKLARHDQKKVESETSNVVCQILTPDQKLSDISQLAKENIADFFAEFEIVPNGIMLLETLAGLTNGSMKVAAHVQFASLKIAQEALVQDGKMMKDCQIGVYRSICSMSEAKARAFPPNLPHELSVFMRSIPATASEKDIIEFFSSAGVIPVRVFLFQSPWDVLGVTAFVYFGNQVEVEKALKCDRNSIDDTSVRVFPHRQPKSKTN